MWIYICTYSISDNIKSIFQTIKIYDINARDIWPSFEMMKNATNRVRLDINSVKKELKVLTANTKKIERAAYSNIQIQFNVIERKSPYIKKHLLFVDQTSICLPTSYVYIFLTLQHLFVCIQKVITSYIIDLISFVRTNRTSANKSRENVCKSHLQKKKKLVITK